MPFIFLEDGASRAICSIPSALSNHLLLGAISRDSRGRLYNTAYVIGKRGNIVADYSKNHLVPFGEYTPLADYFPFLSQISVASGDFFPGPSHDPMRTDIGNIGVLICYEGIFPSITNDTVRRGAEVLVNITNDAWFGKSSAPYQHFANYIFRADRDGPLCAAGGKHGHQRGDRPQGTRMRKNGHIQEEVLNCAFGLRERRDALCKIWGLVRAILRTAPRLCGGLALFAHSFVKGAHVRCLQASR